MTSGFCDAASNLDDALNQLSITDGGGDDRHPERRVKAVSKATWCLEGLMVYERLLWACAFSTLIAHVSWAQQAFRAYEEQVMPKLKAENPTLKRSQLLELLTKQARFHASKCLPRFRGPAPLLSQELVACFCSA